MFSEPKSRPISKWRIILNCLGLALVAFSLYVVWNLYKLTAPVQTEAPTPDSAIFISIKDQDVWHTAPVEDPQQAAFLRRVFGQSYKAANDDPSCPFDYVKISFVKNGRSLDFYPAADDCDAVRYGEGFGRAGPMFTIGEENRSRLQKLWRSYDVRIHSAPDPAAPAAKSALPQ